ncbi:hypothetical protein HZA56_21245 [Candidatus Poribacteria bacterium]|nr:hypothetical protein [Candidatus Poribacteria bacterium]
MTSEQEQEQEMKPLTESIPENPRASATDVARSPRPEEERRNKAVMTPAQILRWPEDLYRNCLTSREESIGN